jgi:alkylation response protein AidB-like acyl-CoA dehydrogenase
MIGGTSRIAQRMIGVADSLRTKVEPCRSQIDIERKLPQQIVDLMRAEQLFSLWLPPEYGGPDLGILDSMKVIEALAQADGAIGWCACTAAINNRLAGFLPPAGANQIFVVDRATVAGALMPTGKAALLPSGYAVSGRWGYASGIDHCTWTLGACSILEKDAPRINQDGTSETLVAFFPTDQCAVIDTWDVGGLRGTGSHDYQVHELYVPEEFTAKYQEAEPFCAGSLYRLPYYSAQGIAIAPVLLGLAQAALGRYRQIAESRIPRVTASVARDDPGTQEVYGRAAAGLRAARAFLHEAVEELWLIVDSGSTASLDHRANARLAFVHAAETAKYVVRILHDDSGGAGLYEIQGLHRIFRDVHAAAQHAQLQKTGFRNGGRVLLGLDPGTMRF